MGRDEQIEEREVLDSIFPDEITDISDTSYRISVALEVTQQDDDETPPPTILLTISYPPTYPDSPPNLEVSQLPNAPKHPYLDIQSDKANLISALEPTVEENLGMAMVFTLYSTLKDSAELLISERQAAAQALKEVEAKKAEEEENRKFHGEAVTRESFLRWRDGFRSELEAVAEEERRKKEEEGIGKKRVGKTEEKMSGRMLWEKGLVGKVDEDEEGEEGDVPNVGKLKFEE